MNLTEIQILKTNIQARLKNSLIAPLFLAGSPGTAKSSTVKLIAKELNMQLVEYSCPSIQIEKMSGLPSEYPTPAFNEAAIINTGISVNSTVWSIPEIVADVWNASKKGPTILLLDDFHALPPHLQAYFFNLLLDYKLGNYALPKDTVIIGTMNDSDKAGLNGINSAIRNRMSILKIQFNFEYWFTNYGNRLHYLVSSFLKTKPHYCNEEETTTIEGYATARAWTSIAAELQYYDEDFIKTHANTIASMQVSTEAARAFHTHVLYINSINFAKLVDKKTLVDLSKQDPLDSIIYSYITNFIKTIDDGLYLFNLMSKNINTTSSSFIGFVLGELYIKYTHSGNISEGLKFVIDKLLNNPMDPSKYPNTTSSKLIQAFKTDIENIDYFMKTAANYLL